MIKEEHLVDPRGQASVSDIYNLLDANVVQNNKRAKENQESMVLDIKNNIHLDDKNDTILILGSKEVIEAFNRIDVKKYDNIIKLKNITNISFPKLGSKDSREVKFTILDDNDKQDKAFTAVSIYNGIHDFLSKIFRIDTFAQFVFRLSDIEEMIENNISTIIGCIPDQEYRFRYIIDDDEQNRLRAVVTTDRYKLYDNNIILYLVFVAMNNYCQETSSLFKVSECNISDSKLNMRLLSENKYKISDGIYMRTGVEVKNSELSNGAVRIQFTYTVSNRNNQFTVLSDDVLTIDHGWKAEKINKKLENLNNLSKFTSNIVSAVKQADLTRKMNDEQIFEIFDKLLRSKKQVLNESIKLKFSELKEKIQVEDNTLNILNLFSMLDAIVSDTDAKEYIRYKFDKYIHSKKWK